MQKHNTPEHLVIGAWSTEIAFFESNALTILMYVLFCFRWSRGAQYLPLWDLSAIAMRLLQIIIAPILVNAFVDFAK